MSLPHLPRELQDLIITNLHPTAAIALSKTSHHYQSIVSLHCLDPDTVRQFLYDLEQRSDNRAPSDLRRRRLACYKCLRIKDDMQFSYLGNFLRSLAEPDGKWDRRQCLECDVKTGRMKPGVVLTGWFTPYPVVTCSECFKGQVKFCRGCRSCSGCLEKKGLEPCVHCGCCDACAALPSVEWDRREKERLDDDLFDHLKVCAGTRLCMHPTSVIVEEQSEKKEGYKEGQDASEDEHEEGDTNREEEEDDDEDDGKEEACASNKHEELNVVVP